MPATAAYLSKYLTASNNKPQNGDFEDSSRPKKRRKKDKSQTDSGLLIADDDEGLLLSDKKRKDDELEDEPLVYSGNVRSAEFRKKKNSAWKTVQDADAEGDRIIADAAREQAEQRVGEEGDEAPAVVDVEADQDDGAPKMSSGAKAGLQTAADTELLLAAETAREEEEERRERKKKRQKDKDAAPEEETIYRDATGRRIDISLARQQARAAEVAKLQAEKKEREAAMGDVQLKQREQAKQDLEDAKFLTLGRTAEDEELNERQKEELRWDDPMAQYIAEQRAEREAEEAAKNPRSRKNRGQDETVVVKLRKREYQGAAPPNRYGIKPGWRWDGVDRGNGFEKEWFQARGRKTRNENLEYQMAYDE